MFHPDVVPINVAITSFEGGVMEESEERVFAAFNVKPAASRELISTALGPSVGVRCLHLSCREEASCCILVSISLGFIATISSTRCHAFYLKRLLFVLDLPGHA